MRKLGACIVVILWLISGLYFGSGGLTNMQNDILLKKVYDDKDTVQVMYDSVPYKNKSHLIAHIEAGKISTIYPFLDKVPLYLSYIITACAFGLLGSLIYLFYVVSFLSKKLDDLPYISIPLLGMLTGLVVLGLSLLFPNLFLEGEADIKPGGLMFVCLICGIFSKKFYVRLSSTFETLLKKENKAK